MMGWRARGSAPGLCALLVAGLVACAHTEPPEAEGKLAKSKLAQSKVAQSKVSSAAHHYDLVVIGGGSGGLACSKAAAKLGKKVAVCDYVKPSPAGTTWGLGGTCVNVGCIPKKLMHHAALLGEAIEEAAAYGWNVGVEEGAAPKHNWERLVRAVQSHIQSLNAANLEQLRSQEVTYYNAFASFTDKKTLRCVDGGGKETRLTADTFVLAPGGRPRYPDIPGAREHGLTSDDIFSLTSPPGKTLVVGASYVALECAGFLRGLGCEVSVMMRSIPLRGFDQQMARLVTADLQRRGVRLLEGCVPSSVELSPSDAGRKRVTWRGASQLEESDTFDTVLLAVGREACTSELGLDKAGVTLNPNGKLSTHGEATNVPHVYAVGDVVDGGALSPPAAESELTPVAVRAGELLAARLYGGATEQMDYSQVPTTIFTPLEYGACGMAEEAAIAKYGEGGVEVYHTSFSPLEWAVPQRAGECYAKLVCLADPPNRIVGLHVAGPQAGEVVQGFAVALKMGATKADFDRTVGIHPTIAEGLTSLSTTKHSGKSAKASSC